jgi:hypothetical protein
VTVLFSVLTAGLAVITVAAARAHAWVVAIGAGALAGFMATLVWSTLTRRKAR